MAAGISLALLRRSICVLFLTTCLASTATSFSFFYNFSNPTTFRHGDLCFEGDAYMGHGSIILAKEQVTGNTTSRSGRVSYSHPLRLRGNDTGEVLGFSANFSFVINGSQSPIDTGGGGLAFFIAPYSRSGSRMPPNSEGGCLGFFNSTTVAGSDWIVAAEVDSHGDHGTVPTMSLHIAVDINKLHSGMNSSKAAVGELLEDVPYLLQVDYSDVTKDLVVVLRDSTAGAPLTSLKKSVDLSIFLPREVAMGISAATGSSNMATQHVLWWSYDTSSNRTINWSSLTSAPRDAPGTLVVPDSPPPADTDVDSPSAGAGRYNRPVLVVVVIFAVLSVVTVSVLGLLCRLSRSSYASSNSLGLSVFLLTYQPGTFFFDNGQLRHLLYLLRMRQWSRMRDRVFHVYDHIPNLLSDHLHNPGTLLTWPMRYKIVLGIGSTLEYLHGQPRPIPHGNIRTDNVMLDEWFNARLGGFDETCTGPNDSESLEQSLQSDMFCFGALILEIVLCVPPDRYCETTASLVKRVWSSHDKGAILDAVDERLDGQFDREEVERLMLVGLWCAHPDQWQRPSIAQAMRSLRSEAPLPSLPPRMPEIFIDIDRAYE